MNSLFVAWRSGGDHNGAWGPVGRLESDGEMYRFCYTQGARTLPGFRAFPKMEDLHKVYHSTSLFPLFANRLLARSRPEYERFLRWGGFELNSTPAPIAVLGVTEGIRQTDSVEVFPCPVPDERGNYSIRFFLHGIRWAAKDAVERIGQLRPGDILKMDPEPENPVDPNAVAVFSVWGSAIRIGYVPRYLGADAKALLAACPAGAVLLSVDRVNDDAPLQQRLLCRLEACWPAGFQPCADDVFQPISDVSRVACAS